MAKKLWLCLSGVRLQIAGQEIAKPPECEALLAVYRTKKAGREVSGPKAKFMRVEVDPK